MKVTIAHDIESDDELKIRFTAEVLPLAHVLHRGALRLTHNDADAEDLLQETLIRAFTGFRNFQPGTNLQAWLFRIQYNQWVSAFRSKERRPAEVLWGGVTDHEIPGHGENLPAGLRSAEFEVLESIPDDDVRHAMEQLSDGFRAVLYYADVEGYTYAETATLLGIPIGTVMSRISRARDQMRRAMGGNSCVRSRFTSASRGAA